MVFLQSHLTCVLTLLLFLLSSSEARHRLRARASDKNLVKNNKNYDNFFHFLTRPDIVAPKFDIWHYDEKKVSPGYWFFAPYEDLDQTERGAPWVGPFMYDQRGEVVWAGTATFDHYKTFDFRVAKMDGKSMLTVIYPRTNAGLILNSSYDVIKSVRYSESFDYSNMHDFSVVDNGNQALVLTKDYGKVIPAPWAESVGVKGNCTTKSEGLKVLDISGPETKTIFAWNGTDHIGADETTFHPKDYEKMCSGSWDIEHFNAIDGFPDGDYLLSSRHTDTLYKIDHTDGSIVWRLGGVKSDFTLGKDVRFTRQHHARVRSQNETHQVVSVFDNAKGTGDKNERPSYSHSRGLVISLDMRTMEAELVGQYGHPRGAITNSRGSNQLLPNQNVFMCWTYHTLISEYSPDGTMLMEARLKKNIHTYRAYKYEWVGRPPTLPDVYSTAYEAGNHTETYIYVSWNGATEVKRWDFYETDAQGGQQKLLKSALKDGFETKMIYDGFARHVVVVALDHNDASLGSSEVFETIRPVEEAFDDKSAELAGDDHFDDDDDSLLEWRPDSIPFPDTTMDTFANPIITFVVGFISCAVACGVFWAAWRYRASPVWLPRLGKYEQVGNHNRGDGEDEPFEDGETAVDEGQPEKV